MFQSSGHVGEDQIWKYLEGAGASFINGTTDFDRTNYLEDLPSNQLELALARGDRMGFLLDKINAASLANQQDVVGTSAVRVARTRLMESSRKKCGT